MPHRSADYCRDWGRTSSGSLELFDVLAGSLSSFHNALRLSGFNPRHSNLDPATDTCGPPHLITLLAPGASFALEKARSESPTAGQDRLPLVHLSHNLRPQPGSLGCERGRIALRGKASENRQAREGHQPAFWGKHPGRTQNETRDPEPHTEISSPCCLRIEKHRFPPCSGVYLSPGILAAARMAAFHIPNTTHAAGGRGSLLHQRS